MPFATKVLLFVSFELLFISCTDVLTAQRLCRHPMPTRPHTDNFELARIRLGHLDGRLITLAASAEEESLVETLW